MSAKRFTEGDGAAADFESELGWIRVSGAPFLDRLDRVDAAFRKASSPFMVSGDDRVLSKMCNAAATLIEEMAETEAANIAGSAGDAETRRRAVERIRKETSSVHWLPEGFRTSISAGLALVASGITAKD